MRSLVRFAFALGAALALGLVYPLSQEAQVKRGAGRAGRLQVSAAGPATNYQVTQTTGTIVRGTNLVTNYTVFGLGGANNDAVATITLPFAYTFYDKTYTTASVSTNGNLQFESSNPDYGQNERCFPLGQFVYSILPYWADLDMRDPNEGIYTSTTDPDNDPNTANRIFNIEWRASEINNAPGSLDFELRLYEGQSRFDIIYGTVPGNDADATVGVQQGAGNTYTSFKCQSSAVYSGQALIFTGTNDTSLFIAGRATDSDHVPLAGVTVNLTGATTATTTTDANGEYIFTGLIRSNTYTVSAVQAGANFYPPSRTIPATGAIAFTGNYVVNFIRTVTPNPGDVLISEFRFRGATFGAFDEFVELINNTDHGITVNATDGSLGWAVAAVPVPSPSPPHAAASFLIPNGITMPPHSHYLAGNGGGYNIGAYGNPDIFFNGNFPDDTGMALFTTFNSASFDNNHRLDSVGFSTVTDPLYVEGTGLASPGAANGNYSFVRKLTGGRAQDTDNNAQDFVFVATDGGVYGGVQSTLGAPGPENSASPIQRNAQVKSSAFDPGSPLTSAPNRVRNGTGVPNGAQGTLVLRRRFTNATGAPVTRLRFRVVDITTLNSPGYTPGGPQADIRVLDSFDANVSTSTGQQLVRGLTLEQAPDGQGGFQLSQPLGGGLNSSLTVGFVSVAQPLMPGDSVGVEFRLGVQQGGSFRFFVNIEAWP
jgi:hypothetical protein